MKWSTSSMRHMAWLFICKSPGCWEYPLLDPPSRDLLSRDSYLSCSSPASSGLATAPSQTLEDPSTPAAASTASFESIDLDTSPNKKAHKQQSGNFSPTFASINEGSGSAGLQSGAMQPQGQEHCPLPCTSLSCMYCAISLARQAARLRQRESQ